MGVQPALAVSWMNPDDRSWVFELREGVRFHDGEPLTAADVVFSLQRCQTHPRSSLRATLANVLKVVFGFDPSLPPPRTDRAAAQKLLASTSFREGFDVDFDVRQMMVPLAAPIVRDLSSVGIRARLNALSENEFFRKARAGESAMLLLRYSCRSGDAQELLDGTFRSQDATRGFGSVNYSYDRCPVPGLDATIDAARRTTDPFFRGRLLREALARNREEALFIPVFNYVTRFFGSPGVVWKNRADSFRLVAEASFRPLALQAPGRLPRNE